MELAMETRADDDDGARRRETTFRSGAKRACGNVTVEPLLALFQVSSVLSALTTQNLNLRKACRVNLRLDERACDGLENKNATFYAREEVEVQRLVADMLVWQTVVQSAVPCALVVLVGSWSDRTGRRKPCMLVPVVGELVRNAGLLLCVHWFYELPLEAAGLVESVPTSVAGGLTVLYLAAFSYIGDVSSTENRTLRIGLMNLFFGAAWPIGAALSGVLFQKSGFYGVYCISTALYAIALVYGSARIRERPKPPDAANRSPDQTHRSCMHRVTDFFNLNHIKEAFRVTFRNDSTRRRVQLVMLMFTIVVVQGPMQGETAVGYLYTRVRFNWNEVDYSVFSTFLFMINILGVGFTVGILSHLLKIDDALIGVFACLSKVLSGIVFAFAPSEFVFYVGAAFDVLSGASYIVVRSILSKIVPHAELGQVSAIVAVLETMVPVVYRPAYSAIYRATVNSFPGTFYVIGSTMLVPSVFIYWWMYRINKRGDEKNRTVGSDETNRNTLPRLQ